MTITTHACERLQRTTSEQIAILGVVPGVKVNIQFNNRPEFRSLPSTWIDAEVF
ncbi:hypothetical protein G3O06_15885 [Burkholderia sp. Ac-20345]|uniref:hypothetical protein n=1 Tax=Burkholderia sp. Ac-20345 TaxID=2703891 RepID=UPI00197BA510|nr:hypothetical protein [Burkholderia sp. Ac-20345]MBN3779018.1 hypothetical protein [Burkholderia sp. Ac-20345]